MKDRLGDLQESARRQTTLSALVERLSEEWSDSSERTSLLYRESSKSIDLVDKLVHDMKCIETLLEEIRNWHWKIIVEPGDHSVLNARLDDTIASYTALMYKTRAALKNLSSEVELQLGKPTDENAQTAEARIKRNQVMVLTKRLQSLVIAFTDEQLVFRDKCKQKIMSYLRISQSAVSEDDLEKIIEKGTLFEHTKGLMLAERDKQALYDEVKTRHEDIIKLEGSLKQLNDLFLELSTLIQSQGEMLNNIERNVESAVSNAQKANTNMMKAKDTRSRVRKGKICIVIACIIGIIFLFCVGTTLFCFYVPFLCR